jgi:hypothetical protein
MNNNIEITNINKHFLLDNSKHIKIDNNSKYNKENIKHKTKIIKKNFCSINEVNISNRVKKILYYTNNYLIVEDYDFINVGQLNEKIIEKLELFNDNKYLIFKYKNDLLIDFNDFIFNFVNPKLLIFCVIESFLYLLEGLIRLNDNNVCFFNLSSKNISFNLDCGEKPILKNFGSSLIISKLNENYITNIIRNITDYTNKPLEVHILFYLIQNDISSISMSFIEEITEFFIKNLSILDLFSDKFKLSYKDLCKESLRKYINKSKSEIIEHILEQNDKWDVYSLSIIYLHILGNISRVFSLKQSFITKFVTELTKNISPEPSNRMSLEELRIMYSKLFSEETEWSFVNGLQNEKMKVLFSIL